MKYNLLTLLMAILLLVTQMRGQQVDNPRLDEFLNQLKTAPEDSTKVMLLDDIAWEYLMMDSTEGLSYAEQGLALAHKLNFGQGVAAGNNSLGAQYNAMGEIVTAAKYFMAGLKQNEVLGNLHGVAIACLNTGRAWLDLTDYPKALEYLLKGLKIFEQLADTSMMVTACDQILIIYSYQLDYPRALDILERVRKLSEESGSKKGMAGYYNDYGLISARLKKFDDALEYQLKALAINEELGNVSGIAGNLNNLGGNCKDKDDLIRALKYYQDAIALNRKMVNVDWISRNQANIAILYYLAAKGETEGARKLLEKQFNGVINDALKEATLYNDSALTTKDNLMDLEGQMSGYKMRSDIQNLKGESDKALISYVKYTELKDSIFNLEKVKKLTQTAMQYEFDQQLALLEAQYRGINATPEEQTKSIKSGRNYALFVGTDHYSESGGIWKNLANPVFDCEALSNELSSRFGYEVTFLRDPKMEEIYKAVIDYSTILDSSDHFLIYFAGHGDFDPLLDDGMIVCANSLAPSVDIARNSYIPFSKLSRMVNRLPSKQVMVMLDVCFGGTFDETVARKSDRGKVENSQNLSEAEYINRKLKYTTRLYISSGGKKVVPDGYKDKHSPFAYNLLDGIRHQQEGRHFSCNDFYSFVKELPSEPLIGSFGDDEPGSDFILYKKK